VQLKDNEYVKNAFCNLKNCRY